MIKQRILELSDRDWNNILYLLFTNDGVRHTASMQSEYNELYNRICQHFDESYEQWGNDCKSNVYTTPTATQSTVAKRRYYNRHKNDK